VAMRFGFVSSSDMAAKRKGPSAGDSGGARGYPVVEAE